MKLRGIGRWASDVIRNMDWAKVYHGTRQVRRAAMGWSNRYQSSQSEFGPSAEGAWPVPWEEADAGLQLSRLGRVEGGSGNVGKQSRDSGRGEAACDPSSEWPHPLIWNMFILLYNHPSACQGTHTLLQDQCLSLAVVYWRILLKYTPGVSGMGETTHESYMSTHEDEFRLNPSVTSWNILLLLRYVRKYLF